MQARGRVSVLPLEWRHAHAGSAAASRISARLLDT